MSKKKNAIAKLDLEQQRELARMITDPSWQAACTRKNIKGEPDLDMISLQEEIAMQIAALNAGSMDRPEAMLISQAHTLDALFTAFFS